MTLVNIPLREEFTDALGRWPDYDCEDLAQRSQLVIQEHVDLRSFVNDSLTHNVSMLDLDQLLMQALDLNTMANLEGQVVIRAGEGWTAGTVSPQSDRNNWNGIQFNCVTGLNTTASVTAPVDISAFTNADSLSVALPAFNPSNYTLAQTFLDITSHPTGDFTIGPTDSLAFTSSTTSLIAGDSELRFPLSLLTNVDRTSITGVRFRIMVTTNQTFRALAIRVLSTDWVYPPIDIDTLYDEGRLPVTLNGSATTTFAFPSGTTAWPVLYRADGPSSQGDPHDPMPIDVSISCLFAPGRLIQADGTADPAKYNNIALYFREQPLDEQIQLDLDALTQADLDAGVGQPDLGRAAFRPRIQSDIDPLDQGALDSDTQFFLERQPDYVDDSYIKVELQWAAASATIPGILTIKDANGNGYTFNDVVIDPLTAYRTPLYALVVELEDERIRVQIFKLNSLGQIQSLVYDTTQITDSLVLKRRRGRFGWWAQFADGDAAVLSIRPRKLSFGSVTTQEFRSDTPVEGARLVVGATPDRELFTSLGASPWGATNVKSDPTKTHSGKAFRIQTTSNAPLQGIQTNEFRIEDLANVEIRFLLYFPSAGLTPVPHNLEDRRSRAGLEIFLLGHDKSVTSLNISSLRPDRWEEIHFLALPETLLGGLYSLCVVQTTPVENLVWWVDQVSVKSRLITWEGRGERPDAWNMAGDQWVPYLDTLNREQGGILFEQRGKGIQVKATAHQQDIRIDSLKVIPRYAELGRFRWRDLEPVISGGPASPSIVTSVNGRVVTFTGSTTTTNHSIITYYWSFGDGRVGYGPEINHTYVDAGTYTVTLITIDDQYRQSTQTATVVVV